ncbi:hypothetical protein BC834DRAFT_974101 [Gloeopeniophorella convolvens]|nr:hypothetical protein BC834DRAFT_974101 [Gloeopeniophorella convolvens]
MSQPLVSSSGRKIKYTPSSFQAVLQGRGLEPQRATEAGARAEAREGCRADERHDKLAGKGVHVSYLELRKDTRGVPYESDGSHAGVVRKTFADALDCVTMLDRVGGGFSLLLHAPGFLPANRTLTPDNIVVDGYIPPREATNHKDALQEPIKNIVEIFARDVALPYLHRTQEYYEASLIPHELTHVSDPASIALAPSSGSSHIRFRPIPRLPLFEDDNDDEEMFSSYDRQMGWDTLTAELLRMGPRGSTPPPPASSSSVETPRSNNVTVRPQRVRTRSEPPILEPTPPLQSSNESSFKRTPTPAQRRAAFVPTRLLTSDTLAPTNKSARNAFISPGSEDSLPPLRFEPPRAADASQLRHRGTEAPDTHREHDWNVAAAVRTSTLTHDDGQLYSGIGPITDGVLKKLKVPADVCSRLRILAGSHPSSEWMARLQAPLYGLNAGQATAVSVAIAADFGMDLALVHGKNRTSSCLILVAVMMTVAFFSLVAFVFFA